MREYLRIQIFNTRVEQDNGRRQVYLLVPDILDAPAFREVFLIFENPLNGSRLGYASLERWSVKGIHFPRTLEALVLSTNPGDG